MGCPWDLPAHRGCPAGPVPNAGDQQRGPVGCPRPASAPSPTVSASPAACKRRAGLDGAAGERHQARATGHQDRLGGTQARPSAPPVNQGAAICSPKISNSPNFYVFLGFNQSPAGRSRCRGGDTDPAQLQAGLSPRGLTGGCGFVPTIQPAMGTHFSDRACVSLPSPSPSAARPGVQRGESGDTAQGQGDSWGRDHTLPYSEGPRFGGALGGGRGGAFVQVLQRPLLALVRAGAVLCALHVIPGGPWGHGDG